MVRVFLRAPLVALVVVALPMAAQQSRVSARAVQQDTLVELRNQFERMLQQQRLLAQEIERSKVALDRADDESERKVVRAKLDGLFERLQGTMYQLEMARAQLQAECASLPGPEGWLGISFNADLEVTTTPRATEFAFRKYPILLAVDPGSPAQKAGLAAGDQILALGNRDMVSGALDIARLLKPGTQLPVRYRRDGAIRNLTVLIEPRPQGFVSTCPWLDIVVGPPTLAMQPKFRMLRPDPNGFAYMFDDSGVVVVGGRSSTARALPRKREGPTPVLPPTPYTALRFQSVVPGASAEIGGAAVIPLTAELRDGLGVGDGFLVLQVLRGSPALEAGLQPGDIIESVNGRKPTTVIELIRVLDETSEGVSVLRVSRAKAKPRIVRLRPYP